MQAEMFPRRPSQGLARTQSAIQQDVIEKAAMIRNVVLKKGTTVRVLRSSSISRVLLANLAVEMCRNM
jgi:hypothetical protein